MNGVSVWAITGYSLPSMIPNGLSMSTVSVPGVQSIEIRKKILERGLKRCQTEY